jgi:hypothetical protein
MPELGLLSPASQGKGQDEINRFSHPSTYGKYTITNCSIQHTYFVVDLIEDRSIVIDYVTRNNK